MILWLSPMTGSWWLDYFLPWLTALSTFAGVVAAVIAGVYAAAAFRRERARDEQREQDQREAQASLVAAWFPVDGLDPDAIEQWQAFVRNASQLPVTSLILEYVYFGDDGFYLLGSTQYGVLPPGDAVILPDRETIASWRAMRSRLENRGDTVFVTSAHLGVNIDFVDAAGRNWRREHHGSLGEIDREEGLAWIWQREHPGPLTLRNR